MIKVGLGHGMVRSLQNYASPLLFLQWLKLQWMFLYTVLYRKTANINVKNRVNLVAEHFGVLTMCSTTKFTVPIFAVFDVCVYNKHFYTVSGKKEATLFSTTPLAFLGRFL